MDEPSQVPEIGENRYVGQAGSEIQPVKFVLGVRIKKTQPGRSLLKNHQSMGNCDIGKWTDIGSGR